MRGGSNHKRKGRGGGRYGGQGQGQGQGGKKRKLALPFKLQRELGIEAEGDETNHRHGGRDKRDRNGRHQNDRRKQKDRDRIQKKKKGSKRDDEGAGAPVGGRRSLLLSDNAIDDKLQKSLAKKLKMKSSDSKFGLDDGLNELLDGLPMTSMHDDFEDEESSFEEQLSDDFASFHSSGEEEEEEEEERPEASTSSSDDEEKEKVKQVGRYVPPSQRRQAEASATPDGGVGANLTRKIRGLLNRITETSVQNIACEIGVMIDSYQVQKKLVQDLICNELVRAAVDGPRASAQFASVTSMCVFGLAAQMGSSEMVAKFTALLAEKIEFSLRENNARALNNLVLILVHMASLGAVSYTTIFSFLFRLKDTFTVSDVECIYTVLRFVGSTLRTSDPARMKEFVISVHEKAGTMRSKANADGNGGDGSLTQKQEILLKSVVDIKNNRQRGNFGKSCHALSPATSSWLKKLGASELCLQNLSWDSLLVEKKKGLWWLSGSDLRSVQEEWENKGTSASLYSNKKKRGQKEGLGTDYLRLASEQRMNTDIRRSIFVVLMSSEDYVDAFERLVGLNLKGSQEREISRVLFHCCVQEKAYNPYYFHIAKCFIRQSKQQRLTFIFTISDKLKELRGMDTRSIANVSNLVAALAAEKLVPFTIIKVLDLAGNIKKKEALFLQILLEQYFVLCSEESIHEQLLGLHTKAEYKALKTCLVMYIIKYFPKYAKHSSMEKAKMKEIKVKAAIALKALRGSAL